MKRYEGALNGHVKEANLERLHIIEFELFYLLEKENPGESKKISVFYKWKEGRGNK